MRWRALIRAAFFAFGLTLAGTGSVLCAVESVTLRAGVNEASLPIVQWMSTSVEGDRRVVRPPEWLAFSLVGLGGVTVLYALALPKG